MSEMLPGALDGLAKDTAGAMGDAAENAAGFYEDTAARASGAVSKVTKADQQIAEKLGAIGDTAPSPGGDGTLPGPGLAAINARLPGIPPDINIKALDLSGRSAQDAEFIRFADRTYGDRLHIRSRTGGIRNERLWTNLTDLARVPPSVHERVADYLNQKGGDAGLYFGSGGVGHFYDVSDLGDLHPHGVPWTQAPGIHLSLTGETLIGTLKLEQYGFPSTSLHEFGHLFSDVYDPEGGPGLSTTVDWAKVYYNVVDAAPPGKIDPYFLENGPIARNEMFVEGFSSYLLPEQEKWLNWVAGSKEGAQMLKTYFGGLLTLNS